VAHAVWGQAGAFAVSQPATCVCVCVCANHLLLVAMCISFYSWQWNLLADENCFFIQVHAIARFFKFRGSEKQ